MVSSLGIIEVFGYFITAFAFWLIPLGMLFGAGAVTMTCFVASFGLGVYCLWLGRPANQEKGKFQKKVPCEMCNTEVPTKHLAFQMTAGLLVFSIGTKNAGRLCAACARSSFWKQQLLTLGLGWWSIGGLFTTPVLLVNNIINYFESRNPDGWTAGAPPISDGPPKAEDEVIDL